MHYNFTKKIVQLKSVPNDTISFYILCVSVTNPFLFDSGQAVKIHVTRLRSAKVYQTILDVHAKLTGFSTCTVIE